MTGRTRASRVPSPYLSSAWVCAVAWCLLHAPAALAGHHTFRANLDAPVTLRGPITRIEWLNPHVWLHIDVRGPDGTVSAWAIEAGSPNALYRRGWNKSSVRPGTEVVIRGFRASNGSNTANCMEVMRPDGTQLFVGSPSTDIAAGGIARRSR